MGLSIAGGAIGGIAAMVMTGGSALIPDGAEAFAKTGSDMDLPLALLAPIAGAAVVSAAPPSTSPTNSVQ
jgi:hypothetical protein